MVPKKVRPATPKQKEKYSHYLSEGEEIIAAFGIGDRYFWLNAIPLFLFSLPLIGLPFLLKLIHLKHSKVYLLTDRRVLIKDGVFSVKVTTAPYDKITHISVREGFFEKVSYGIGDITIHTAGPTPVEIDLVKVENPIRVKNLIEELILLERGALSKSKSHNPLVRPFNL